MVQISKIIKYLGTYLDNGLSFKHNISTKCRVAMLNLQHLKPLQPSLTVQACITLVLGLVMSHLDYVNSAFIGLPASDINKMQKVQNAAAKFVLNLKSMDSSTEALKTLHWLSIKFKIQFKILLLVLSVLMVKLHHIFLSCFNLKSYYFKVKSTIHHSPLCTLYQEKDICR